MRPAVFFKQSMLKAGVGRQPGTNEQTVCVCVYMYVYGDVVMWRVGERVFVAFRCVVLRVLYVRRSTLNTGAALGLGAVI